MTGSRIFGIAHQTKETGTCVTTTFDGVLEATPGQFVMVWVPGVDEFPMSLSKLGDHFGITYKVVGKGTQRLSSMGEGEKVGVRGPYGRGYELKGRRALAVAGGTGMASLAPLVESAVLAGADVEAVIGARTGEELLFAERAGKAGARVHVATDDGTEGTRGTATDLAEEVLQGGGFDQVYSCGPERMIVSLLDLARKHSIGLQASLERYMKCGIGICDSCALDGMHVCRDGPVFFDHELSGFAELGRTKLNRCGRRIPLG